MNAAPGGLGSPQGLKPNVFNACCGTTKVVPFQNSFMRPALAKKRLERGKSSHQTGVRLISYRTILPIG